MIAWYIILCLSLVYLGFVAVRVISRDARDVWADTEWERYEED